MTDVIVVAILAVVLGLAIGYMYRAKRKGTKCIGCSAGSGCPASRVSQDAVNNCVGRECPHCQGSDMERRA